MKRIVASLVLASALGLGEPARADIVVYEGFQYGAVNDSLHGQPDAPGGTDTDAIGLAAVWTDSTGPTGNMFMHAGSLPFGNLATNGNHIAFNSNANNDTFSRPLSTNALLVVSNTPTLWFSILAEKLQNDFSAAEGGFVLSNQPLAKSRVLENNGSDGLAGFGVAPTTSGNNWKAYAWNGTTQLAGDASISVGIGTGDRRLLVGRIMFDAGTGGTDQFSLYQYRLNDGAMEGGTLSPIGSTLEVNVDQAALQLLDTVNITRQVNTAYDELRIGTTQADVLPVQPAPVTATVLMIL